MDIPQNLRVTMRNGLVWFKIGEHDLSLLPISERGPIIECLTPGVDHKMYVAWVPVLFEGDIKDPLNMCRTVHDGEAETLIDGRTVVINVDARASTEEAVRMLERSTIPKLRRMLDEGKGKREDGGESGDV